MFVDKVKIYVKAGRGGDGCVSFRRERFIPKGGPDGGNGGVGGDVILEVSKHENNLRDLKFNQHCKAKNGLPGQGTNKNGSNGTDKIVTVPPGTLVKDFTTKTIYADLTDIGQTFTAGKGGDGGWGNKKFTSSTNQAPRQYTFGKDGEERILELELKTIADVALVGYPSAGKSTFFNISSDNTRETAPYPFTTLTPMISRIIFDDYSEFTLADIPGLIEGAHKNLGLGFEFLRHIERASILAYVIDMGQTDEKNHPINVLKSLNQELNHYQENLAERVKIILANKMDEINSKENLEKLKKHTNVQIIPISAEIGENCPQAIEKMNILVKDFIENKKKELNQKKSSKTININLNDDDFI